MPHRPAPPPLLSLLAFASARVYHPKAASGKENRPKCRSDAPKCHFRPEERDKSLRTASRLPQNRKPQKNISAAGSPPAAVCCHGAGRGFPFPPKKFPRTRRTTASARMQGIYISHVCICRIFLSPAGGPLPPGRAEPGFPPFSPYAPWAVSSPFGARPESRMFRLKTSPSARTEMPPPYFSAVIWMLLSP